MAVSPMMQQYFDAKAVCGDALLLFRMGDFYELFHEDAKTAARALGLTLTSREKGENAVPMAGFPHHQLESYLAKLIALGFRAAICEQVEDPKQAKGLVRREVARIVSPGTITDDALLDPRANNYLAAVVDGDPAGLAWVELSTGRFLASCPGRALLADELARIAPVELLVSLEQPGIASPEATTGQRCLVTRRPAWAFAPRGAAERLAKQFGVHTLEGFGFTERDTPAIAAAGALLDYLIETQKTSLGHIDGLVRYCARRRARDRRIDPPQPGNYPHDARWPPRGLVAGSARSRRHRHGLETAGRLGGQSADRLRKSTIVSMPWASL